LAFEMKEWAPTELSRKVGKAYGGFFGGKFFSFLLTYAGCYRGNHIHPNNQSTVLLSGKATYVIKRGDEIVKVPLEAGRRLDVEAGVPHILLADEETLTVEWWDGEFKEEKCKVLEVEGGKFR